MAITHYDEIRWHPVRLQTEYNPSLFTKVARQHNNTVSNSHLPLVNIDCTLENNDG